MRKITIKEKEAGQRLDKYLRNICQNPLPVSFIKCSGKKILL